MPGYLIKDTTVEERKKIVEESLGNISAESEENQQILFDDAVEDAMIIDKDEILPVVSLEEGQPYAVYDEEGRILLYTFL